jgi:hypothetical protein
MLLWMEGADSSSSFQTVESRRNIPLLKKVIDFFWEMEKPLDQFFHGQAWLAYLRTTKS